jgi:hypothetical protein
LKFPLGISNGKNYPDNRTELGSLIAAPIGNPAGGAGATRRPFGPRMNITRKFCLIAGPLAALLSCSAAGPAALKDAVVLIVRHADKPETGAGLSAAGQARAQAYVKYFGQFQIDGKTLKLDSLFAARDSENSVRPRLTLEPLSRALNLPLHTAYTDKEPEKLAAELASKPHGKNILVCWRHKEIPALLRGLGADPAALLPGGAWPDDVYCWVIELRFDGQGRLMPSQCKRINEHLTDKDTD